MLRERCRQEVVDLIGVLGECEETMVDISVVPPGGALLVSIKAKEPSDVKNDGPRQETVLGIPKRENFHRRLYAALRMGADRGHDLGRVGEKGFEGFGDQEFLAERTA